MGAAPIAVYDGKSDCGWKKSCITNGELNISKRLLGLGSHLIPKDLGLQISIFKSRFTYMGVSQNGCLMMGNPIKMDDLGLPLFWDTP